MLHQHIPYQYVDAIIDRRTPRPAPRLLELSERSGRRRTRRSS